MHSENISQLKSINLSFRLLTTLSSNAHKPHNSSITTLKQLSNRLTTANQQYLHKQPKKLSIKPWKGEQDISLDRVYQIVKELKNKSNGNQQEDKIQSWESLEYFRLSQKTGKEYLSENEQRIAYYSVLCSFDSSKATFYMSNLLRKVNQTNSGYKISEVIKQQQFFQVKQSGNLIEQFVKNFKENKYSNQQSLSIDKIIATSLKQESQFLESVLSVHSESFLSVSSQKARNNFLSLTSKLFERQMTQGSQNHFGKDYKLFMNSEIDSSAAINQQIYQNFTAFLDQIYSDQQVSINSIKNDPQDSKLFQALKCIINGKLKKQLFTEQQFVAQGWMIILALGLRRNNRQKVNQYKQFKRTVKGFTEYCIQNHIENKPTTIPLFSKVISVFIGLGAYSQIMNLYKALHQTNKAQAIITIQTLIFLTSKYHLIKCLNGDVQAKQIMKQMTLQIGKFSNQFKKTHQDYYCGFILIFLQILKGLDEERQQLKQLPVQLGKILTINIKHLETLGIQTLQSYLEGNSLGKVLLQHLISNVTLHSNQELMHLAHFCSQIKMLNAIIKFLLQEQLQNLKRQSDEPFHSKFQRQAFKAKNDSLQDVKRKFYHEFSTNSKNVVDFLICYKELKEQVLFKKTSNIVATKKQYQRYLQDYRLLNQLLKLSQSSQIAYLDLYISYYGEIRKMYKMVFIKNHSQLKKSYNQLIKQLKSLQNRYSCMNYPKLKVLLSELAIS